MPSMSLASVVGRLLKSVERKSVLSRLKLLSLMAW